LEIFFLFRRSSLPIIPEEDLVDRCTIKVQVNVLVIIRCDYKKLTYRVKFKLKLRFCFPLY